MNINSVIVKIQLSRSAQSAFDKFFKFAGRIERNESAIFMHNGMLAIQLFGISPNPEEAIKVLTDFVGYVKELANAFEKEVLS